MILGNSTFSVIYCRLHMITIRLCGSGDEGAEAGHAGHSQRGHPGLVTASRGQGHSCS